MAEFDTLFADAVQGLTRPKRTRLRLDLVFSPDNAARPAELTARENGCCSFLGGWDKLRRRTPARRLGGVLRTDEKNMT